MEAIRRALALAGETACALHVVHVSCGEGVALVTEAQSQGVDVSCETCPHYLTLTEEDLFKLGAPAKCAPPLRPKPSQDLLWQHLSAGRIDLVASDHSPAPPEMTTDANFFKVWAASQACNNLTLLIHEGHARRRLPLTTISRLLSSNVANRFRLPPEKGGIKIGGDADLALVKIGSSVEVRRKMQQRHRVTLTPVCICRAKSFARWQAAT